MDSLMQPLVERSAECRQLVDEKTDFVFSDPNHRLNPEYQEHRLMKLAPIRKDVYVHDARIRAYHQELRNGLRVSTFSLRATFEGFDEKVQEYTKKVETLINKIETL